MGFPEQLLLIFILSSSMSFCVDAGKTAITVSRSGQADFQKIQDAIDAVPSRSEEWIRIRVSSGVYQEKVTVPGDKPYIYIEGDGSDRTIIRWNDHGKTGASGTFTSEANNFAARGIAFQNHYNTEGDNPVEPAVAAVIHGDKSAFFDCSFVGVQDTLLAIQGRHYFSHCYIEGSIDFICGDGQSFFQNCEIVNTRRGGYITAQKRESPEESSGFVFYGGRVSGPRAFLGRAWGPSSRVVFYKTDFDLDVEPLGWDAWDKPVDQIFYLEEKCTGKGSDVSRRVSWSVHDIPEDRMQAYTRAKFIDDDDWLDTLPYTSSDKPPETPPNSPPENPVDTPPETPPETPPGYTLIISAESTVFKTSCISVVIPVITAIFMILGSNSYLYPYLSSLYVLIVNMNTSPRAV